MQSEGQSKALEQLERIASTPRSALRIDYVDEPSDEGGPVVVDISIDCRLLEAAEGGLKLNSRESIRLFIPSDFPYGYPSVWVGHKRFEGFPHVQWVRHICLYQAPDTEWRPEGGMFDFMRRIHAWLRDAALNQLDADGAPLHPPAVYPSTNTNVCINADTHVFDGETWIGAAVLNQAGDNRFNLNRWLSCGDIASNSETAPAILLSSPISFEYPTYIWGLVNQLNKAGVSLSSLIVQLSVAAATKDNNKPMHVVVGTPMRGIAGQDGERKQHLAIWEIEPLAVQRLALVAKASDLYVNWGDREGKEDLSALTDEIIDSAIRWMKESKIGWCGIMENRPEVTQRRDHDSPVCAFKGKKIGLLGCGAIGGHLAEYLTRAGVGHITLIDNSHVNPGILVRQNYRDEDIGNWKADALKNRLLTINPSLDCKSSNENIYQSLLTDSEWAEQFDVVIDATASLRVRTKLEEIRQKSDISTVLASLMISSRAEHAAMAVALPGFSGATLDVLRKLGLSVMNRAHMSVYSEAFWPTEPNRQLFQPEPGCSDPTFIGSSADVGILSGKMLNKLAEILESGDSNAYGLLFSRHSSKDFDYQFTYRADILIKTAKGVDVRLSQHAWKDIQGWISSGARERGPLVETGGLLFGEFNDVVNVLWVNEVIGPPSDSQFSETEFICGTSGSEDINQEKKKRTESTVKFVGTWHSHPISEGKPSAKDLTGIAGLFANDLTQNPLQLMMIIGQASNTPEVGAYIFNRSALSSDDDAIHFAIESDGGITYDIGTQSYGKKIGLALSGGGSRAIAYHLGCLRALNDLGLLDDVEVVSGVSGGSVMAAIFGYSHDCFNEVDKKTVLFLKKGLLWPCLVKLIFKLRLIPAIFTFIFTVIPGIVVGTTRKTFQLALSLVGFNERAISSINFIRWPLRRWYSRSHVVAETLRDFLGQETLDAVTRNNKAVVFNACELATGTAFRMSNTGYGSWRFGKGQPSDLLIADAVAASAAFPPGLPAFDWIKVFENPKSNEKEPKRVIITDGGVYENLGVSCMEPGRPVDYSVITYSPEVIISCDAGAGQFSGDAATGFWPFRMSQAFNAVYRKVQDATKGRLHSYAVNGQLAAFVYSNLGQIDSKIPGCPSTWVSREEVMSYPTNFSAMANDDLKKISDRGEFVTRTLVSKYLLCE